MISDIHIKYIIHISNYYTQINRSIYEEFLNNFCLFVEKDSKNIWMNQKPDFFILNIKIEAKLSWR